MGQKSNPIGLRLQINRTWDSRWYAEGRDYAQLLKEDVAIRKYIMKNLPQAAVSKVVIERPAKLCRVSIYAARPGVIIGKKGADIEKLRLQLAKMTNQICVAGVLQGLAFVHDLDIPCCQKVKLFSEGVVLGCVGGVGLSGFSVQKGMCDMPQFSRVIEGPGKGSADNLGIVSGQRGDAKPPMGVGEMNGSIGVGGGEFTAFFG